MSYRLVETEFSRFGSKLASSFQNLLHTVSVASFLANAGPGAKLGLEQKTMQKHKEMEDFPPYLSLPRVIFV